MTTYVEAKRKARYSRQSWLCWQDRSGTEHAAPESATSLKAALLAVGTKGRFIRFSGSLIERVGWRVGVLALRNHRFIEKTRNAA